MEDNAKESCMVSFRLLHSHLTALSNNHSKGTCIKGGFERAFVALFDHDIQTFTCSMLKKLDQLEKQLDKEEFQETGSIDAFRALMTQFQTRSGNDTHTDDEDINFVNEKWSMAEVQLYAKYNILSNEQQHSEQSETVYDTYLLEKVDRNTTPKSTDMSHRGGEIDQNTDAKKFLQPPRNTSVVKQSNAFKSERPNFSIPRFASQVDVSNVLSKPVTPHYLPKVRESTPAKPHHVNAPSSSRNSQKESYGSNDMAHNYYLEESKKKTQDKNRNLKPREMTSAKTHHTPNACTPKPRSNNQTSWNWPASKSCEETLKAVQKADHSRNPSSFSDFKHFVCSTCQKCVFNVNHDACITKFLKEVNSHAKIQPNKTRNSNNPVDPTSHTQKPCRKIVIGHSFSPNKSSAVHEKTNTPRSCLRWMPACRIFNIVGLKWVPTEKTFTSSTTKVDCEPQMIQMIISLTLINAIKLSMSVQKVEATLKSAWTEKDQIDNLLKERRWSSSGGGGGFGGGSAEGGGGLKMVLKLLKSSGG
nr:hypothetical protein [Tanacetum cinerariifolium]